MTAHRRSSKSPVTLLGIAAAFAVSLGANAGEIPVSGRVQADSGDPAAFEVRLFPARTAYEQHLDLLAGRLEPEPAATAKTDALGRYRLAAPSPGLWRVEISSPDRGSLGRVEPVAEARKLPLARPSLGEAVTVRVRLPNGEPAAGAWVLLEVSESIDEQGAEPEGWGYTPQRAVADERGEARLRAPARTSRRITAFLSGLAPAEFEGSESEIALGLGATAPVALEVHDERDRPASGVLLGIGTAEGTLATLWPLAMTDGAGRASVALPSAAGFAVTALAVDHRSTRHRIPLGSLAGDSLQLRLEPPDRHRARVVDALAKAPVGGALVSVLPASGIVARTDGRGDCILEASALEASRGFAVAAAGYYAARFEPLSPEPNPAPLALHRRSAVEGLVVDHERRPVAGAQIGLRMLDAGGSWARMLEDFRFAHGESAAEGYFALAGAAGHRYELTVVHPDFAPFDREVLPGERLEIVLARGLAVLGRVVDAEARGVAGAEVSLSLPSPLDSGLSARSFRAKAAADGGFRIEHLHPGSYRLRVRDPRSPPSVPRTVNLEAGQDELDLGEIELERGTSLVGRVLDEHDRPLAEVGIATFEEPSIGRLLLEGAEGLDHLVGGEGESEVRTDQDGRFEISGFRRGARVQVQALDPGRFQEKAVTVTVPSEEPLEIRLLPAARVTGMVSDARGRAITGAWISARPRSSAEGPALLLGLEQPQDLPSTETDEKGRFDLRGLPTGEIEIEAEVRRRPPVRRVLVLEPGALVEDLELTIDDGLTLEGRVLDETGAPIARASVTADAEGEIPSGLQLLASDQRADGDGRFRFEGLSPGAYLLRGQADGYQRGEERVQLVSSGRRVDLVLNRGRSLRGMVVDEAGEPVAGAQITMIPLEAASRGRVGTAKSQSDGFFTVSGLDEGAYLIAARKERLGNSAANRTIEVGGGNVEGVRLVLAAGAVVRGRVLGLTPEDWPQVLVRALTLGGENRESSLDAEGSFVLEGLPTGDGVLFASEGRSGRSTSMPLHVEAPETTVEIEFDAAGAARGRLLLDGAPVAGALIASGARLETPSAMAVTGADGRFELGGLPAGTQALAVLLPGGRPVLQRMISLVPGQEVVIALRSASFTGQVLEAASGEPVAGAAVALSPHFGSAELPFLRPIQAVSDAAGRFSFEGLIAGPYRLAVEAEGFEAAVMPIELAPGASETAIPLARRGGG